MLKTKSGKALFPIGIGTWNISSRINPDKLDSKYRGVEPVLGKEEQEIEAIRYSCSLGQNHIDCAEMYGGFYTDEVVGRALEGQIREDIFIADKLWKSSVGNGNVRPTVIAMLKKLKTTYIDLLYIHSPFADAPWQQAIAQIDELIDEGLVRGFGVSNFTISQMIEANNNARHPIVANQMNFNVLYKHEVDQAFMDYCQENEIVVVAYQPTKRQEIAQNSLINAIAKAHNATPSQISLAWLLAKGTLPIPKSTDKRHIAENLDAINIKLSQEEIAELDKE